MQKTQFKYLLIALLLSLNVLGAGTYIKGPALIEGFTTTASAAGTLTLTVASETKQIITGVTTHTVVMPDATTLVLGRKFLVINKSTGLVTVNASGGGLLGTIAGGAQAELHLRAAGSAAGTWDLLSSSSGGGGVWGTITGTLSDQTDLNTALGLKAPLASPTFTGTITTPLTASRALVTGASSELAASAVTATQLGYLGTATSDLQVQLDAKQARSTLTTAGDIYVATASGVTTRQGVGNAGEVWMADPDTTNKVRYGTPVGTNNYMKANPSFEGNAITGWTAYADAAGTSPVDCTGGSPNTAIAIDSSAPILNGSYQMLATLTSGATRQGEGFSYAFTIPTKYSASPAMHQIEFDYAVASGTFVAGSASDSSTAGDSTYTVWVYDVTNGSLIQPSTHRLYSTTGYRWVANFPNNSGSTSYRLCVHKGTSATVSSNITVKFDDFKIDQSKYSTNTIISDWVPYTPTFTNFGTATSINIRSRRVGDSLEVQGRFTSGTTAASEARMSLGYAGVSGNVTIDSTKIAVTTDVGSWSRNLADTSNVSYFVLADPGNTYIRVGTQTASAAPYTAANTNAVADNGGISGMNFTVPIQGWSSTVKTADGFENSLVNFRAVNSSTSINSTPAKISWTTVGTDDVNGYSSGTYTAKTSAWYDTNACLYISGTPSVDQSSTITVYKNGSASKSGFLRYKVASATTTQVCVTDGFYLDAGQTIEIYGASEIASAAISSSTTLNVFTISRRNDPRLLGADPVRTPTIQKFLSGTAATYTTPVGVKYLKIKMIGGGAGGGGSGVANNGGTSGAGGNTIFGTSLLTANGGSASTGFSGGSGGTATIGSGAIGIALDGASGSSGFFGQSINYVRGTMGSSSPFGGGGTAGSTSGGSAPSNTGAGGGGGSMGSATDGYAGAGGAAGGYIEAIIPSPSATYTYTVGAGGAGGAAGTTGYTGGAGAAGVIIVEEHYQ